MLGVIDSVNGRRPTPIGVVIPIRGCSHECNYEYKTDIDCDIDVYGYLDTSVIKYWNGSDEYKLTVLEEYRE